MFDMISIVLNLLRLVLCTIMWSILERFHVHLKRMCFFLLLMKGCICIYTMCICIYTVYICIHTYAKYMYNVYTVYIYTMYICNVYIYVYIQGVCVCVCVYQLTPFDLGCHSVPQCTVDILFGRSIHC
ncbi:hypothetical protein HJG60_010280 [Phyllostomus discolor]|uniref:Uncharacterized protein n=1 Tax=Phyllostomus discolor TaxID=89673 RepID=A0A834AY34_9CHIR|nr:hypothetical protein HJG60_010280 [Phyllostomus discolor]